MVTEESGQRPLATTPFPSAAGASASSPAGLTISSGPQEADQSAFQTVAKASLTAVGNSGTQIFGGYFSEEYLATLRGRTGAKKWDEMRRSEAQIAMLLNAIINPIKAANWDVEPYDESDPECVKHAELCKMIMFEMIDFNTFKHEMLTFLPFGFSLFEIVHNVIFNHPQFGTFNGLKSLAFRSQKTIENWQLEQKTGRLVGVNQYTYSDLGGNQFIPGEFLLVFTHSKEGDNYEGISILRPMLGAYMRKDLYLKLAAIGMEKYAVGVPIGTIPAGKERTVEADEFKAMLASFTSHENAYMVRPAGWLVEITKNDFDASKVKELLTFENTEFANAVVGNFLALGMNGGGGAYALGSNLGEFFQTGMQSYADLGCDGVNRTLFPNIVQLNFGKQRGYPKLKCTGISDKAGKELAESIKMLADARALDPDQPFKEHVRKAYKFPKPDPTTATPLPVVPAGGSANYPKPNDPVTDPTTGKEVPFNVNQLSEIKLSDAKYVAKFDKNKAKIKALMQSNLQTMYEGLKDKLKSRYNSLSDSEKVLAPKGVDTPGVTAYKSALRDMLAQFAAESIQSAKSSVKLSELDTHAREHIAVSNYAIPETKSYPIHDLAHARNALSRSSGKPEEAKVRAAVYKKWPSLNPSHKLTLIEDSIKLGEGYYNALPAPVRNLVNIQANLVVDTQVADIEKSVFFSFVSSASKKQDIDAILNDVDETVEPSIDGSTAEGMSVDAAASNSLAQVAQQASLSYFFDPDVIDGIESFTFTNEDPVSEICQALAGTTFAVGDSDLDEYTPPLHHNCKSRLVPNLKGDSDNPEIDRGGVSLTKKALASITLCDQVKGWKLSEDVTRRK